MAITEVDRDPSAGARMLRDAIAQGLQEPLAEVVRTLQHLAIAQVSPDSPQLDPQLLVRARSLAHGLSQVVDELVCSGTQQGVLDGREPQETVLVRDAIETAASVAAWPTERCVVVRGTHRVAITTNPAKFQALLVQIFQTSLGDGDLRIVLERSRGELLMQFEASELSSPDLDAIRAAARTIGGSADRTIGAAAARLVVWLPQQRVSDPIER
jgi:hypothetical protein